MEAIILAGGKGTRLSSVLNGIPKPMAPIGNRVFLEIILRRLKEAQVTEIVLSVGYKASVIQQYFGNEYAGLKIKYAAEPRPLGTGGAIRAALAYIRGAKTLVLNGDTYLDLNYRRMIQAHELAGRSLSIAALEVPDTSRYGQMLVQQDTVVGFSDQASGGSGTINAGVYVVEKGLFHDNQSESFSFERDFLARFVSSLRPYAYRSSGYFIDIGIPDDYARAQHELTCH